jgi:outer membrane beta-barrel protein
MGGEAKMGMTTTKKRTATRRRVLAALTAGFALLAFTETAGAQEVQLTGPLAGAPAVRKLRLYREGRFEIAPHATFTLLDEYKRNIIFGLRINYNLTDWLGIGVWGGYNTIKYNSHLTDQIQGVNQGRIRTDPNTLTVDRRLTAVNLGPSFEAQLGTIDWIVVPQLTGVPFRGKLALFKSIYVDTEIFFFAGLGIVGLHERKDCARGTCNLAGSFVTASRTTFAPSLGMGLSFFTNKWNALTAEARVTPFSWNIGGFDTAGGNPNGDFPDNAISKADRQFRFNMMLTVGYSFYLPLEHRTSE